MRVTFQPSLHYKENLYCNESVEKIVDSLAKIQQSAFLASLMKGIIHFNTDDKEIWESDWIKPTIKKYRNESESIIKPIIYALYTLKKQFGQRTEDYLAVIVPKYVLEKLETRFDTKGSLDVYICIEKNTTRGKNVWQSKNQVGSNSVDVALWNDLSKSGACYECKLGTPLKQGQIDFLYSISRRSNHKIEVGIASFESEAVMKAKLSEFKVHPLIKIITRDNILLELGIFAY